ncbi:heme exporter protein CcmD [Azorhizobium sp. AG788]|uniref:heme exporter protein CcmD n=1 Tax=Azorhizobium sp. AG788 TaxID=2183897 RepID=UPI0031395605
MSHTAFIVAAYGAAFLGLGILTLALLWDNRAQRRALADLEARGIRRRASGG